MVRMRISVVGEALRIWRVTSTPFRRGMPMSRMAMCGLCLAAFSTASRPSAASAQTCQRVRESSSVRRQARDAHAEARLAAMGRAVRRNDHTAAGVGDFQSDALRIFAEDDLGTLAA